MSAVLGPALTTAASLTLVMMEGGFCSAVAVPAGASVAARARAGAVGEHDPASQQTSLGHEDQHPTLCSLALSGQRGVSSSQLSQQRPICPENTKLLVLVSDNIFWSCRPQNCLVETQTIPLQISHQTRPEHRRTDCLETASGQLLFYFIGHLPRLHWSGDQRSPAHSANNGIIAAVKTQTCSSSREPGPGSKSSEFYLVKYACITPTQLLCNSGDLTFLAPTLNRFLNHLV